MTTKSLAGNSLKMVRRAILALERCAFAVQPLQLRLHASSQSPAGLLLVQGGVVVEVRRRA